MSVYHASNDYPKFNKRERQYYDRVAKYRAQGFEWIKEMQKTKEFPSITWEMKVAAFDGCCLCAEDTSDVTHHMIVDSLQGGKYESCNIIPVCPTCSVRISRYSNPLEALDIYLRTKKDTNILGSKAVKNRAAIESNQAQPYLASFVNALKFLGYKEEWINEK